MSDNMTSKIIKTSNRNIKVYNFLQEPDYMESEPAFLPMTGLNLDNYFPTKISQDSVLYVHKKFLPQYKNKHQRKHKGSQVKKTWDKCTQFDSETPKKYIYKVKCNTNKVPLVEQTIRFAKSIIPLTTPSPDASPRSEYTIKITKKPKKLSTNNRKSEISKNTGNKKEKRRHIFDCFRRDKRPFSSRDSEGSSQNNTLDDLNENRSLSCTLSEISEKKHHNEERHCKRNKRNEMQKVGVSESFEAVATEYMNTCSDAKIKIHLMNEKDKTLFCENIQAPVIGALKECIIELNNENLKALHSMQTTVKHQEKKIDVILDKLTSLEEKLEVCKKESLTHTISKTTKASKLEELSADIFQVKEVFSSDEEELGQIDLVNQKAKDSVEGMKSKDTSFLERENEKIENLGCGEAVPGHLKAQTGIKPERLNRVPTRHCWTDSRRNI